MNKIKNNNIIKEIEILSKPGIKLGLDSIREILSNLNNPQNSYKIIHIAGSNGKGSVAAILENVLYKHEYNVGKYTSPHLVRFNERIRYNKMEISNKEIKNCFNKIKRVITDKNIGATFFDITTAIMFLYFSKKDIDYLILETGLGGRYDSTNIAKSDIVALTNISLEHSNFLGDTISEIAREKAGIIKDNTPVFYSVKQNDAKNIIKKIAKKKNCELHNVLYNKDYEISLDSININTVISINNISYTLPLYGEFQGENFLLAHDILKYIGLNSNEIQNGLKNLIWEGRFEVMERDPYVILDGAHNVDSAKKLKDNICSLFKKEEVVIISSILKDKKIDMILDEFKDISSEIIFTSLKENIRGLSGEELIKYGKNKFKKLYFDNNINNAFKKAKKLNKKAIVIAGSLYLIGKVKRRVSL